MSDIFILIIGFSAAMFFILIGLFLYAIKEDLISLHKNKEPK